MQAVEAAPEIDQADPVTALRADNDIHLDQLVRFLACVPSERYCARHGSEDAIGAHVRHLIEHYESLLRDADSAVDYDRRARDSVLEQSPAEATARIAAIRARLTRLTERYAGQSLAVVYTPDHERAGAPAALYSSLARELMFLLSHTVHHMALIAILARQRGLDVPPDFGVAPSTLRDRDRATEQPCAH